MFATEDTIKDIKEEILKHHHFMMPKASQLSKAEKSKIHLKFNGEDLVDDKTLGECGIGHDSVLMMSLTSPLS